MTFSFTQNKTLIVGRQFHSHRIKHQLLDDNFIHTE